MRRRLRTIIVIAATGWAACQNGAGPSTVPEPRLEPPPAAAQVEPSARRLETVSETAAHLDDDPPMPPWHRCLNDLEGVWQVDDGKRCVAIQGLNDITGWQRECGHNRAYFPAPDWRCCVDDGTGRCVPGSEVTHEAPPGGPQGTGAEEEEPAGEDPEEPAGLRVWIYGTNPQTDTDLCEGDFIHALGIRRSDAAGLLRGSVHLVDPELAEIEETGLPSGSSPIQGEFAFADGEDQITSFVLDGKKFAKCPKCSELRSLRLGIGHVLEIEDEDDPDKTYEIGDELVFRIRKETDERCQPE